MKLDKLSRDFRPELIAFLRTDPRTVPYLKARGLPKLPYLRKAQLFAMCQQLGYDLGALHFIKGAP